MPAVRPERQTQNRVIERMTRAVKDGGLGYAYLGDWSQREGSGAEGWSDWRCTKANRGFQIQPLGRVTRVLDAGSIVFGEDKVQEESGKWR